MVDITWYDADVASIDDLCNCSSGKLTLTVYSPQPGRLDNCKAPALFCTAHRYYSSSTSHMLA